jgi:membrane protein DedA with SNARE-associated domain
VNVRREALVLVALVLLVDAVFVAGYFLGRVQVSSDVTKLIFTVVWTAATLAVVVRGLTRIRTARRDRTGARSR